jgi:2-polyprenyl-3-methyl-5-hydroxy-6-metoxy-1,4-benzoquinol methylase
VVMLAVLEHLKEPQVILEDIYRILIPGGSLIMTWPQAVIDPLLDVLRRLGFVSKEMEGDLHQRRIPLNNLLAMLDQIGFQKFRHQRFELGLNNLLVSYKAESGTSRRQQAAGVRQTDSVPGF